MLFEDKLKKYFDKVYKETDFVERTCEILNKLGFNADNSIACAGVCRDEISQSFPEAVNKRWGYAFNFSSLAGMFSAGKTGLMAAMHHSPVVQGKERYVFYALPHIAIDDGGRIGFCKRRGREGSSNACGALVAFQKELKSQKSEVRSQKLEIDNSDVEYSLIKMRLAKELPRGRIPGLLDLTRTALKVIQEDLQRAIDHTVDTGHSDYAVFTGIQIHGPVGNYVWPASHYAIIDNKRKKINL